MMRLGYIGLSPGVGHPLPPGAELADFDLMVGLPAGMSYARAGDAWAVNAAGNLVNYAANALPLDWDSAGAPIGPRLAMRAFTTYGNNTMLGTSLGTISSGVDPILPDGWGYNVGAGYSNEILSVDDVDGFRCVTLRISRAPGVASWNGPNFVTGTSGVPAVAGNVCTGTALLKIVAGSFGTYTPYLMGYEYNSSGGYLTSGSTVIAPASSGKLAFCRQRFTRTLVHASAAYAGFGLAMYGTDALDVTIQIAMPMLVKDAEPPPFIECDGTAPVARNADTLTADLSSFNFANGASLFARYRHAGITQNPAIVARLDDGTENNRISLTRSNTAIFSTVRAANTLVASLTHGAPVIGTDYRHAVSAKLDDFQAALNGAAGTPDTSGAMPSGLTTLRVGKDSAGAGGFNGNIARVKVWPKALGASVAGETA